MRYASMRYGHVVVVCVKAGHAIEQVETPAAVCDALNVRVRVRPPGEQRTM